MLKKRCVNCSTFTKLATECTWNINSICFRIPWIPLVSWRTEKVSIAVATVIIT